MIEMLKRKLTGAKPETILPQGSVDSQLHIYLPEFEGQEDGPALPPDPPDISDYLSVCDWLGVDNFIVTVANAYQRNNDCLLEVLRRVGTRAAGVAAISEDMSDAQITQLRDNGIVGARIMDLPGGAYGLKYLEGVDTRCHCFDLAMAVQFDGSNICHHEKRLLNIKSRYVIDHHGKFFCGVKPDSAQIDTLKRLIDKGNCWFKFAGCYESSHSGGPDYRDIGAVARVIATHAPERIIWGTNFPHNMAARSEDYPCDASLLDLAASWVPEKFHDLFFCKNSRELFSLNLQP
ncbi:amidohydrolase family protein [Cohaesibacter gelatinilyticus]|mgnify:CR=1 FL=1|uniref:D-galactarolactone isomerase n=1 Tax=Cohaesibacter gelatinilyticus TaxID=372072 RepID=A0A285NDK9_9HYPH|nr:amidohydrolase family protein [Cohaesibacter gelatinilyticus]SNZ07037.1 D-galactarolactone isomerase [Cohaesibacter gelatinilyticus]